jgi:hypothetical protein
MPVPNALAVKPKRVPGSTPSPATLQTLSTAVAGGSGLVIGTSL